MEEWAVVEYFDALEDGCVVGQDAAVVKWCRDRAAAELAAERAERDYHEYIEQLLKDDPTAQVYHSEFTVLPASEVTDWD